MCMIKHIFGRCVFGKFKSVPVFQCVLVLNILGVLARNGLFCLAGVVKGCVRHYVTSFPAG